MFPLPPAIRRNLAALQRAGFHVATLAGNHIADAGPNGVEDTVAELHRLGIATTGAGMNLAEARRPAIDRAKRTAPRISQLQLCGSARIVGGRGSRRLRLCSRLDALRTRPCISGRTTRRYTPSPNQRRWKPWLPISRALRPKVDVLMVALHKGLGHTPATVGMYESQIARAAIDAGADVVVGHHAHILQGHGGLQESADFSRPRQFRGRDQSVEYRRKLKSGAPCLGRAPRESSSALSPTPNM